MTFNKYSSKISLLCIIIPYISAFLTNFIPLPYANKSMYKLIMVTILAIVGAVLAYLITSKSDSELQKMGIMADYTKDMQKYWLIEYDENTSIPYSILKICDNCDSVTESMVIDFNQSLEIKKTMGIHGWLVDDHMRLSWIHAFGGSFHSVFRFTFKMKSEFDIIRIEDSDLDTIPVKKLRGLCKEITPRMLVDAGAAFDEKSAKKDLAKFQISSGSYKLLLENVYKNQNTSTRNRNDIANVDNVVAESNPLSHKNEKKENKHVW